MEASGKTNKCQGENEMTDNVRFYFSFRSPYSWLALHRINLICHELPVELKLIPVFPSRNKTVLPEQAKIDYMIEDVNRTVSAYGLNIRWPKPFDTDWLPVHMAAIYAEEQGKGIAFCLAMYKSRFVEGRDIGEHASLRDSARETGLNEDEMIDVLGNREYKRKLLEGMAEAGKAGVFGVPFFIYKDSSYWGNDRLEWLLRDINSHHKQDVPKLADDPFARPC